MFVVRWTDTHSHQHPACGHWESTYYTNYLTEFVTHNPHQPRAIFTHSTQSHDLPPRITNPFATSPGDDGDRRVGCDWCVVGRLGDTEGLSSTLHGRATRGPTSTTRPAQLRASTAGHLGYVQAHARGPCAVTGPRRCVCVSRSSHALAWGMRRCECLITSDLPRSCSCGSVLRCPWAMQPKPRPEKQPAF